MTKFRALLRSMPFRLAFLLLALFTAVSLISFGATYLMTVRSMDQTMRDDLRQDMSGFRAAPNANALAALVEAEASVTNPERLALSYVSRGGREFGNSIFARGTDGYLLISLGEGNPRLRGSYLTLTDTLWGGQLTIARNRAEIDALGDVFWNILALSLLPTIVIALSGGLYLAGRSARQVGEIGAALDQMTTGKLSARVAPDQNWTADLLRIGTKVDQMADAQEASVDVIRQVSSDIAHDLKTPLQRVAVHLDDLGRQPALPDDASALVASARAEVEGMASVFVSLLQIAQIESGSPTMQFAPVDLAELARTFVEIYEPAAADSGRSLAFIGAGTSARILGDRNLLGQALANLIENAICHTPAGANISVALEQNEGAVLLSVTDNGKGIPDDKKALVLRRLYRLDRSRTTPGNGLGLSLVASIAKLHDAALTLLDANPGLRVELGFAGLPPAL